MIPSFANGFLGLGSSSGMEPLTMHGRSASPSRVTTDVSASSQNTSSGDPTTGATSDTVITGGHDQLPGLPLSTAVTMGIDYQRNTLQNSSQYLYLSMCALWNNGIVITCCHHHRRPRQLPPPRELRRRQHYPRILSNSVLRALAKAEAKHCHDSMSGMTATIIQATTKTSFDLCVLPMTFPNRRWGNFLPWCVAVQHPVDMVTRTRRIIFPCDQIRYYRLDRPLAAVTRSGPRSRATDSDPEEVELHCKSMEERYSLKAGATIIDNTAAIHANFGTQT